MSHKIWKIQSAFGPRNAVYSTNNFQNYKVFKPANLNIKPSNIKYILLQNWIKL